MKIALIGYGKMGRAIEQIALQRGHSISHRIDASKMANISELTPQNTDLAIEFTNPDVAYQNLYACIAQGVPVVSGTTGWLEQKPALEQWCREQQGAFFYASNYSIGVNLFFRLNTYLASIMAQQPYDVSMEEIHHTEKKDAPSGTAITLAEGIIKQIPSFTKWTNDLSPQANELGISSKREANVAGTHSVKYSSLVDQIEIIHTAHSREGFATGAVLASEWLLGKKGIFGMDDLLAHQYPR